MKFLAFVGGLVTGAICGAAGLIYLQMRNPPTGEADLTFAPKNFADFGGYAVGISGTLTGDGVAYKNNTYAIYCLKERMECWISSIEQIGEQQIGRMDYPYSYPVTTWNAQEVIVDEMGSCARITITITRTQQTALWVQQPINQTRPECKNSDTKTYKWSIENSPGWKRAFGK
jgi:hypothetical protein